MQTRQSTLAETHSQAHTTLSEDLRGLELASRANSPEDRAQLLDRLQYTHNQVVEHFRFEEQNGYMEAVRKRQPRLERTIQELAMEHRELTHALEELAAQARSASPDDEIRQKIREWLARIRHHETQENELVQDAFNLDIAAED